MRTRLTSIGLSVAVLTCSAAANPPTVEQCKANIDAMVARMNGGATGGPYRPNWKSLEISVPGDLPDDLAYAFKLSGFKTSLTPEAQARRDAALSQLQSAPIDPGKKQADNIMFGSE